MKKSDYVPNKDVEFNIFQINMLAIVAANLAAWGIVAADMTALTALQTQWTAAFNKASNKLNRTSADVQAKDDARKIYEKALRNFVALYLSRNPKVSDSERERMGINIRLSTHVASPTPVSFPVGDVDFSIRLQHTISFGDSESPRSKAKPKGVHGCEIWMKIDGEAPKDPSELSFVATSTSSPYLVSFAGEDVGKIVYYWLRWVNKTGKTGPWSSLFNGIVAG